MMMTTMTTTGMTGIKENGKQVCAAAESFTGEGAIHSDGAFPLYVRRHMGFLPFFYSSVIENYM